MTGWWRGTRLIVGRELLVGFRRKSYRVTLAVLLLGGLAVSVVPRLLSSGSFGTRPPVPELHRRACDDGSFLTVC